MVKKYRSGPRGVGHDRQALFVFLVAKLIEYAAYRGHLLTFGDAARMDRKGHMPNSLHYDRLAIDLNLFVGGVLIEDSKAAPFLELGVFWENLNPGCQWGGRFGDANHFSFSDGFTGRKGSRIVANEEDRCHS